jgi:excisionase family DNA binding protein
LSVSKRTIWRLLSGKRLPEPLRIGGSVRWRREQIDRWIEQGCPSAASSGPYHNLP